MITVGIGRTERISKLREKVLCTPEVCLERGYWMTKSYEETEGEPEVIRRAKALANILKNLSIHIEDGELIVGTFSSKIRGGPVNPELQWEWYLKEMDEISTREWDRYTPLTEEEKVKMHDFLPYWNGKSLYDKYWAMLPENAKILNNKIVTAGHIGNGCHQGHVGVDFQKLLTQGLNGIKKQVDKELEKLNLAEIKDFEKCQFLRAVNITLEAVSNFARRYAELARNMAKKESHPRRKTELERIAEICDWVPVNPARSFYEALQSVWFIHICLMLEGWAGGMSFGRPDQYLYPFYKKDLEEGRITKEEARELIALLYIKINHYAMLLPSAIVKFMSGHPLALTLTLGGLTRDGKDAVNELSYIFLDAEEDVGLTMEEIIIRIHKNNPDAFVIRAAEIAKSLRGKFKFVSDETAIQQLLKDGKPIEYARDYIVTGCNTPNAPGYSQEISGNLVNLPLFLELALNNGTSRLTGEQLGPKTGDPRRFKSYEEVWNAYKKQVEALMPFVILYKNLNDQLFAGYTPCPLLSALFNGCIEKGLDITQGGTAPYMAHAIELIGTPNVGDSLAAIKRTVFDDKTLSMDKLIDALDKNFEGEEEILCILKSAPKFGNDDSYVDSVVNDVLVHASEQAGKYKGIAGAVSNVGCVSVTANVAMGQVVGASPDGRRAGESLAEGGISPHQGRNVSGPTATMMSVAKLDHVKVTNGSVLNMRFDPDALKDESKMRKFTSLIRTFCETGGYLVQFNIVDTDTLRNAQKHPEKYRDLLVRVSTYSAYFVELSPDVQSDIIARMEFQEV